MNSDYRTRPLRTPRSRKFCGTLFPALTATVLLLIVFPSAGRAAGEPDPGELKIGVDDRSAIIDGVCSKLNQLYVFPEIAGQMEERLRSQQKNKIYDDIGTLGEFVRKLNTDLLSVYPDGHLELAVLRESQTEKTSADDDEWWARHAREARYHNFYFRKVEWLPGNIGYVDWREFEYPELSGPTAVAVMGFLAHSDALIIDLRLNPGGRNELTQLILSYFFEDHRVHYLTVKDREKDTVKQWWTIPYVPGPRLADIPIYVLTSKNTGSAAEEFAYVLKHLKRATIVGERTAGAAHKTHRHNLPELQIVMYIPVGTSFSPVTGEDWEGKGVEPDIKVPAAEALRIAHIEALKVVLKKTSDERHMYRLEWVLKGLEVEQVPVVLSEVELRPYVGEYGPRTIGMEDGRLYYQRQGRPKFRLAPMGDDTFMLEGLDWFRVRFGRDQAGAVSRIIGLYEDGRQDQNVRTEG